MLMGRSLSSAGFYNPAVQDVFDYEHGISVVDSVYDRRLQTAVHLIVEDGRAAIVDTGTSRAAPRVLAALASKGIAPEQVDYVVLTHIHLDHAGGAGQLMALLPNARLTVHPRGARHIIDPGSQTATFHLRRGGDAQSMAILPVPAAADRDPGGRDCPALRPSCSSRRAGHARHHRGGATVRHIFAATPSAIHHGLPTESSSRFTTSLRSSSRRCTADRPTPPRGPKPCM
jgi:hypothetical protein